MIVTGYKRYYDVSKKKFIADDFETEIGDYTQDFIEDWFATPSAAEESAYGMNRDLVSIEGLRKTTDTDKFAVCVCKECHKPFGLVLTEYWWFTDRGLSVPKRCLCCRKKRK